MTDLTLPALTLTCQQWQARLRLEDWDVVLAIVRQSDLGEGTLGDCQPASTKRQAKIRLLDTRDIECQGFWFDGETWNWEVTLVHELLHLHFHDIIGKSYDSPAGLAAERAIHAISKALVALKP